MGVSRRGWRDFARKENEIRLYFGPDDWPHDIPRPPDSTLCPRPFLPYIRFKLEADQTIETVTVELEVPLLFADKERQPFSNKRVNIVYFHSQRETSLRTVIRRYNQSEVTHVLILRQAVHPLETEC